MQIEVKDKVTVTIEGKREVRVIMTGEEADLVRRMIGETSSNQRVFDFGFSKKESDKLFEIYMDLTHGQS